MQFVFDILSIKKRLILNLGVTKTRIVLFNFFRGGRPRIQIHRPEQILVFILNGEKMKQHILFIYLIQLYSNMNKNS